MYLIKSQWKPVLIRGYVTGANVVNIIIDTNRYLFVETFCPEISLKHVQSDRRYRAMVYIWIQTKIKDVERCALLSNTCDTRLVKCVVRKYPHILFELDGWYSAFSYCSLKQVSYKQITHFIAIQSHS